MADPVLYLRGPFAWDSELSGTKTKAFAKDAKEFNKLTIDSAKLIGDDIEIFTGFLDLHSLELIVRNRTQEVDASLVANFVSHVESLLAKSGQKLTNFLDGIAKQIQPDVMHLSIKDVEALRERLPLLLRSQGAFARYRKSVKLASATGMPLEDVQLICDMRPVFDSTRKSVDGFVLLNTLRIVATTPSGLPQHFEVVLSERRLADLGDKVEAAKRKTIEVRNAMESKGFNVLTSMPERTQNQ
jgi:hypothetical protein